jgi:hypothetical protein
MSRESPVVVSSTLVTGDAPVRVPAKERIDNEVVRL